jgi:hypothetical protein
MDQTNIVRVLIEFVRYTVILKRDFFIKEYKREFAKEKNIYNSNVYRKFVQFHSRNASPARLFVQERRRTVGGAIITPADRARLKVSIRWAAFLSASIYMLYQANVQSNSSSLTYWFKSTVFPVDHWRQTVQMNSMNQSYMYAFFDGCLEAVFGALSTVNDINEAIGDAYDRVASSLKPQSLTPGEVARVTTFIFFAARSCSTFIGTVVDPFVDDMAGLRDSDSAFPVRIVQSFLSTNQVAREFDALVQSSHASDRAQEVHKKYTETRNMIPQKKRLVSSILNALKQNVSAIWNIITTME